ncbi:MAG: hypothetical protein C4309_09510, partial [Chloroflexota bacterium]
RPLEALAVPGPTRLFDVYCALQSGVSPEAIAQATGYDPWFLAQMAEVVGLEREIREWRFGSISNLHSLLWRA